MLRSSIPTTIEIQENISFDCGVIDANPTQLHQILMNLCTNAFHAMEEKGGVLRVGLQVANSVPLELKEEKPEAEEVFLELSISDTGQGIGPDTIDKIFDPFTKSAIAKLIRQILEGDESAREKGEDGGCNSPT